MTRRAGCYDFLPIVSRRFDSSRRNTTFSHRFLFADKSMRNSTTRSLVTRLSNPGSKRGNDRISQVFAGSPFSFALVLRPRPDRTSQTITERPMLSLHVQRTETLTVSVPRTPPPRDLSPTDSIRQLGRERFQKESLIHGGSDRRRGLVACGIMIQQIREMRFV
jgi:hypothetical protein